LYGDCLTFFLLLDLFLFYVVVGLDDIDYCGNFGWFSLLWRLELCDELPEGRYQVFNQLELVVVHIGW